MNLLEKIKNFDIQICKYNIALLMRAMLLLTPVMLLFYQENGLSVSELFLFQAIFYLTSIAIEIPVGYISDRIPKKNVLILSYSAFLFVTALWLKMRGYWIILLGEIIMAVSKVMLDNAQSGYLYDYLSHKNRSEKMTKNYGYQNFYLALGTAIAALVGTYFYTKFGSSFVLLTELIIALIGMFLVMSLPSAYNPLKSSELFITKIKSFIKSTKLIYKNPSIRNYIYYSGFLTSFSIIFALSFQPLMLMANFPIALFGIAAFFNHGIRALSGAFAGKFSKIFSIRTMIIPLFILYILSFGCIFTIIHIKNTPVIICLIFIICLIIGCQLLFTIRHISRLHTFVDSKERGILISLNNLFSRTMAFVMLFSSKLFIDKLGFENFYLIMLGIFVIFGAIFMANAYKIKEA